MSRRSVWSLNSANSQALADFVDARGATGATWASGAWDDAASADYILVVATRQWRWQVASPELTTALRACGASSALNGLPDYDGQWLNKPYLLVAQCGSGVASAERGLELVGESGDSLALEVDLAEHFFFGDGVAHAAASLANYTYDLALTPRVLSISRLNGTTAGGTTVELNVTGIARVPAGRVVVRLAGIVCATTYDEIGEYRGQHLCLWDGVECDGLGVRPAGGADGFANVTTVTCLSNPWDWSYTGFDGNARSAYEQPVELYVENWGDAEVAGGVLWSYADLYVEALSWPRRG